MTEDTKGSAAVLASAPLQLEEHTQKRRLSDSAPTTAAGRLKETLYYARGRGALEIGLVYGVIVVAFVIYSGVNPAGFPFLSPSNLSGVISQSIPVLALLALGAGILMIAGEFDLSAGASIGFCAIVFIRLANSHGWPLALVAALASGVGIALINGVIVVVTRIPSFIATLGMSFFWIGASIFLNGTTPAVFTPGTRTPTLLAIFAGDYGFFRSQIVWMIGVGFLAWWFLHRHRLGNHIYAVGGNASAASAVSIKPNSVRLMAFGVFGLLVGLTSVLIAVRTSGMQPGTTGDYTLFAIAAAVVGGCSLTGGRGSVLGMIIGAALIRTVENGLILGKAPGFYTQLFVGVTIVIAATFNKLMEGKSK
ncbi:MAG: ABC transporter permease [Kineosporiaceae bacterium]